MKSYERLLKYAGIYTTSDDDSDTFPTTARQLDLANLLADEMKELRFEEVRISEKGYVYGSIPAAAGCEKAPVLEFIAHMDTAPDAIGEEVKPQVISN